MPTPCKNGLDKMGIRFDVLRKVKERVNADEGSLLVKYFLSVSHMCTLVDSLVCSNWMLMFGE